MKKNQDTNDIKINQVLKEAKVTDGHSQQAVYQTLSENLPLLAESINQHNIYDFRFLVNKLNAGFLALGLTSMAEQVQRLNAKCVTAQDLVLNEIELQELIKTMKLATPADEPG